MTAEVLGLAPEQVRIVPSACGGGFGGKLDVSVAAARRRWRPGSRAAPVACVYEPRPESIHGEPTKRHPASDRRRAWAAMPTAALQAVDFRRRPSTPAPMPPGGRPWRAACRSTATGPYAVPGVSRRGAAPFYQQRAAVRRLPRLRRAAGRHRPRGADGRPRRAGSALTGWSFRLKNAIRVGDATATGQVLEASAGLAPCLEALGPAGSAPGDEAARGQRRPDGPVRRGRRHRLHVVRHRQHRAQQPVRPCASPSIARAGSRSTTAPSTSARARPRSSPRSAPTRWVSRRRQDRPCRGRHGLDRGRGQDLRVAPDLRLGQGGGAGRRSPQRAAILREANAADDAEHRARGRVHAWCEDGGRRVEIDLGRLKADERGVVLEGVPAPSIRRPRRSTPSGQGAPYATYAFGAQVAVVDGGYRARHRDPRPHGAPPTMSAAPSTRPRWKDRSTAASPRASAWR